MKRLSIINVVLISLTMTGRADLYWFPAGETPALSLVEAASICEKMAKEVGIGKFNPSSANLMGSKVPGKGSWVFKQYTRSVEEYVFHIAFTEKTATVLKMRDNSGRMKRDIVLATFRLEGLNLVRLPNPLPPPEETDDPFADETTPDSKIPQNNKDGKAAPLPHTPDSPAQNPANPAQPPVKPKKDNAK